MGGGPMGDAETERLWLRRWQPEHAAGLAAVNADPVVMHFLNGGVPLTRVESGLVSDRVLDHWKTYGFGLWAVVEKATERMIGFAGLCHPLWFPDWSRAVEVGWRLHRDAWGCGYATEAGREALRVGMAERGLHEIVAFVHEGNHRSAAVADRLHMIRRGRVPHPSRDHQLDVFIATRSQAVGREAEEVAVWWRAPDQDAGRADRVHGSRAAGSAARGHGSSGARPAGLGRPPSRPSRRAAT